MQQLNHVFAENEACAGITENQRAELAGKMQCEALCAGGVLFQPSALESVCPYTVFMTVTMNLYSEKICSVGNPFMTILEYTILCIIIKRMCTILNYMIHHC